MQPSTSRTEAAFPGRFAVDASGYLTAMSEAGIEVDEADRLEQAQGMDPDPALAAETGPDPVPVSAEQLAAGMDAEPADVADQGRAHQLAEESHADAGPGQEHPE